MDRVSIHEVKGEIEKTSYKIGTKIQSHNGVTTFGFPAKDSSGNVGFVTHGHDLYLQDEIDVWFTSIITFKYIMYMFCP